MEYVPNPVIIPLLNPNEPEAHLVSLAIEEGQYVEKGQVICTLETTKSTTEMEAEASGYVVNLRYRQGQLVRAGEILCYLSDTIGREEAEKASSESGAARFASDRGAKTDIPEGLRITQPALDLARQSDLDLEKLPVGPLVTESMIQSFIQQASPSETASVSEGKFDPMAIVIYGGGGHGKKLIDLIRFLEGYRITGIIDDGLAASSAGGSQPTVMGLAVLGGREVLPELFAEGVRLAANGMGGIGRPEVRLKVSQRLAKAGFVCPPLVHPRAFVEPSATLSPGVQVFPNAYVGSEARLGRDVIVNNGAIVSHDCQLGDFANIAPGALIAGEVHIGDEVLIGMGATVTLGVKIGRRARLGNGSTIKAEVPENAIVQAGAIWPGRSQPI
jgi:acetyltransferase EpsM